MDVRPRTSAPSGAAYTAYGRWCDRAALLRAGMAVWRGRISGFGPHGSAVALIDRPRIAGARHGLDVINNRARLERFTIEAEPSAGRLRTPSRARLARVPKRRGGAEVTPARSRNSNWRTLVRLNARLGRPSFVHAWRAYGTLTDEGSQDTVTPGGGLRDRVRLIPTGLALVAAGRPSDTRARDPRVAYMQQPHGARVSDRRQAGI